MFRIYIIRIKPTKHSPQKNFHGALKYQNNIKIYNYNNIRMPTSKIDYSKTLIIKIVSKDLKYKDFFLDYCQGLKNKIYLLKKQSEDENHKKYNSVMNKFIREYGGWDNFDVIIVEEYKECKNPSDAKLRLRYWYDKIEKEYKKNEEDLNI
jgi:hypothetical protein